MKILDSMIRIKDKLNRELESMKNCMQNLMLINPQKFQIPDNFLKEK